jgi:hypothetical protein
MHFACLPEDDEFQGCKLAISSDLRVSNVMQLAVAFHLLDFLYLWVALSVGGMNDDNSARCDTQQ